MGYARPDPKRDGLPEYSRMLRRSIGVPCSPKLLIIPSHLPSRMLSLFGKIDTETAKYTTTKELDHFTIREYDPAVGVSTDCGSSLDDDENSKAFRRLASYIGVMGKPHNESQSGDTEKISMTAPVVNSAAEGNDPEKVEMTAPVVNSSASGSHMMTFILPSKYTMENAPKPTDEGVRLQELPRHHKAALSFSGSCSDEKAKEKAELLVSELEKAGIAMDPSAEKARNAGGQFYEVARYNPPWTLPFLRTNEVLIPVSYKE